VGGDFTDRTMPIFFRNYVYTGVPLTTEPTISLIILPLMRILQQNLKQTYKKCDDIITYAGSGHHLRPDRFDSGVPYFGKSLPVRPLSLPEFLRWCLLSRRLWFVVCFGKQNKTLGQMTERAAERRFRQETGWLAGGLLLRVATIRCTTDTHCRHSSSFLTQRTYSCSNFVAISLLVLELLKKCQVW
jgi:hypothetical protein